jgi:hypothetical protein
MASAQTLPQTPAPPAPLIRVFLTCDGCDSAGFKDAVPFAEFVIDRTAAIVEVAITNTAKEPSQRVWQLAFTGREAFAGQDRRLTVTLAADLPPADLQSALARQLRFGLVEYALKSDTGKQLDVTMKIDPKAEAAPKAPEKDPWNYWVYRLSVNGYQSGEVTSDSASYSGDVSASRTTEAWKMRFGTYASRNTSRFDISDTDTIHTSESDWAADTLIVKSLTGHWSAGFNGGVSSSTYSNAKLRASLEPAVEYDVFPYSESSQRSLTIQYSIGPSYYEYFELTIYDKLQEAVWRQNVNASLGLRQPWGSIGASAGFSQLVDDAAKYRVSVFGNVSVRLFKGFQVNGGVGYSRIRDQIFLEKSDASPEEILLRLRQLETGYSFNARIGVSFSFGSLANATVNPRFGG